MTATSRAILIPGLLIVVASASCAAPIMRSAVSSPLTPVQLGATAPVVAAGPMVAPEPIVAPPPIVVAPQPIVAPPPIRGLMPVATNRDLLNKYVGSTVGLEGVLHATAFSAWGHWRGKPSEWDPGTTGYAKRWTSKFAQSAVGNTAKYAVARIFHQDPSFTVCQCTGFGRRLRHAVASPFVARARDGRQVFSGASLAGAITGHVVAKSTWYPAKHGARDGLRDAGLSIMSTIGVDVFKEFRPRRK